MGSVASIRMDKWLFYTRLFKSRGLAAEYIAKGRFRLNARTVSKPATSVRVGDVLTIPLNQNVIVVKVLALGTRRGPAAEAQLLYEHLV